LSSEAESAQRACQPERSSPSITAAQTFGGTTEIQNEIVARGLGLEPDQAFYECHVLLGSCIFFSAECALDSRCGLVR
jgi:hypothetical protein